MINLEFYNRIKKIIIFLLFNISLIASPLRVGVSDEFNIQLLNFIKKENPDLDFEIIKKESYENLNKLLKNKEIDVNLFQTLDYLKYSNIRSDISLVSIVKTYIEPLGIYSKRHNSIKEIENFSVFAIPSDFPNQKRSLLMLEKLGIIELNHSEEKLITDNIIKNPFQIIIFPIPKQFLGKCIKETDYVILDVKDAYQWGFIPLKDAVYLEEFNPKYVNVVVTREKLKNNKKVRKFAEIMKSSKVRLFILNKYGDNVKIYSE
jgi:D-methionine transport system substrate-binding protein